MATENRIRTNGANDSTEHSEPSIIVPGEKSVTLSRSTLDHQVKLLQQKLAATGDFTRRTVAVALPNSIELVSLFLAITTQQGIAALLNPAYKENELDFYLDDVDPVMVIVPKGAYDTNSDSVRAAKRHGLRIAECYWDGNEVVLDVVFHQGRTDSEQRTIVGVELLDTDITLLLHTSGTSGRPKTVSPVLLYIECSLNVPPLGVLDAEES